MRLGSRSGIEQLAQPGGGVAADRERLTAILEEQKRLFAGLPAHERDSLEMNQLRAADPLEPLRRQERLPGGKRPPEDDRLAIAGQADVRVVAHRFDPEDVADADRRVLPAREHDHPIPFVRFGLFATGRRGWHRLGAMLGHQEPGHRLVEPERIDRLEEIVGGAIRRAPSGALNSTGDLLRGLQRHCHSQRDRKLRQFIGWELGSRSNEYTGWETQ